jgi:hypothetical protein
MGLQQFQLRKWKPLFNLSNIVVFLLNVQGGLLKRKLNYDIRFALKTNDQSVQGWPA